MRAMPVFDTQTPPPIVRAPACAQGRRWSLRGPTLTGGSARRVGKSGALSVTNLYETLLCQSEYLRFSTRNARIPTSSPADGTQYAQRAHWLPLLRSSLNVAARFVANPRRSADPAFFALCGQPRLRLHAAMVDDPGPPRHLGSLPIATAEAVVVLEAC